MFMRWYVSLILRLSDLLKVCRPAFQYLHASVALQSPTHASEEASHALESACASEHASDWENYSKEFECSERCTVRLGFETLNMQLIGLMSESDTQTYAQALYSLDIHLMPKGDKEQGTGTVLGTAGTHQAVPPPPVPASPIDGTGEWKYWDGHIGKRPPKFTDAVGPLAVTLMDGGEGRNTRTYD